MQSTSKGSEEKPMITAVSFTVHKCRVSVKGNCKELRIIKQNMKKIPQKIR